MEYGENHTIFSFCVDDSEYKQLKVQVNECSDQRIEIGMEKEKLPKLQYACKNQFIHKMLGSDIKSDKKCCHCKLKIPLKKQNIWDQKHTIKSIFVKGLFTDLKNREFQVSRINLKDLELDPETHHEEGGQVDLLKEFQDEEFDEGMQFQGFEDDGIDWNLSDQDGYITDL